MAPPPTDPTPLSAAQLQALEAVRQRAALRQQADPPAPQAGVSAAHEARSIHIHFHPDWRFAGSTVIERLAQSGRYQSQFETGSSNGSYSPQAGGQRWQWEHEWFSGAYDDAPASQRPVYGAVDLGAQGHASRAGHGAAPRFGSAWLQLHSSVASRSSFCDPDSFWQPHHTGLWPQMDWQQLQCLRLPDPLDHYVEAQIHGGLLLERDVAALVLDPSFADTAVAAAAARCHVPVRWHGGYRFHADMLPAAAEYRGRETADTLQALLQHVGTGNGPTRVLRPADLGRAQAQGAYEPQLLKKAWHCLARFGGEAARGT